MCTIAPPAAGTRLADALLERIFNSTLAAFDIFAISLGDRLGYYRTLVANGPQTAAELAAATGTNERYTREWLEQQAVTGILDVALESADTESQDLSFAARICGRSDRSGQPLGRRADGQDLHRCGSPVRSAGRGVQDRRRGALRSRMASISSKARPA